MLTEKQIGRYAEVLLWGLETARKKRYRKNDIILIRFDRSAIRLAEFVQAGILDRGMHPVLRMNMTFGMETNHFKKANHRQLIFQPPGDRELLDSLNGAVYIHAPESLTHLRNVEPKKIAKALLSRKPLRDILDRREQEGAFGWTLCTYPTPEPAKQAGLTAEQYAAQVIKACYLNRTEPVRQWQAIYRNAAAIKRWMNSMDVDSYHVESENTDLWIRPGQKRQWVGISGHNIPSFEIFLSPDCRGTEGVYYANLPSFRSGNLVEKVRIEFKAGKAVGIHAEQGRDFILKQVSMDPGARMVGEFSLTDKRFSKIDRFMANTLFDENFGGAHGNCHVALGASYADTYDGDPLTLTAEMKKELGFNDSALHWDLVNTENKRVTAHLVSGKKTVIYENGIFRY